MEAALDSLGAVELRNALSQSFAIELPATLAFDHPSISAITTYIGDLIGASDNISNLKVGRSREHSRQNSFYSMEPELASLATVARPKGGATAIYAMSCRFPSPAGAFHAHLKFTFFCTGQRNSLEAHVAPTCGCYALCVLHTTIAFRNWIQRLL